MNLYTPVPLELVLDGWSREPGPFLDITVGGIMMRVRPIAPGIGRIERIISAPLDCYLAPAYAPGQTVCYAPHDNQQQPPPASPYVHEAAAPFSTDVNVPLQGH